MNGQSMYPAETLETLVKQNFETITQLKSALNEIIKLGPDYDSDISNSLKTLLKSTDSDILTLTAKCIAELAKCENKRQTYACRDFIIPLTNIFSKSNSLDVLINCCRSLGNLCCDCDAGRHAIIENNTLKVLLNLLQTNSEQNELTINILKTFLNFSIGGKDMVTEILNCNILDIVKTILEKEAKSNYHNDEIIISSLSLLTVINDNLPEHVFAPELNSAVLGILKETSNIDISELCFEHLNMQAEHDSVKTLLATENGVQLVCSRLEMLQERQRIGPHATDDAEVESVMRQACDLIIIVLTGDEAMHLLYNKGTGEVYRTMFKWLDSDQHGLLTTAILAMGNFARNDEYCLQIMENGIFDKLLDLFEKYHVKLQPASESEHSTKIEQAALSALRNLLVPLENKRTATKKGRAAKVFIQLLPDVVDPQVAYKLMGALRLMIDGKGGVANDVLNNEECLKAISSWGNRVQYAGAAGEAPRLIAAAITKGTLDVNRVIKIDGCITCLANMLVSSHSIMQNEAILSLTLLALHGFKTDQSEKDLTAQLIKSEIGQYLTLLIESGSTKLPIEVIENVLAFLEISATKNELCAEFKRSKVAQALEKVVELRKNLSDSTVKRLVTIIGVIGL